MATDASHALRADLARVTESLQMLAPRWSVWLLMTLADKPLRYTEIKPKLSWLRDAQVHPKLRKLTEAGLVERTEYSLHNVTYGLTARGTDLLPVLTTVAAWGDAHLEKRLVRNKATGELEPERIPTAQNAEDTITLISPRRATPILWVLKARGTVSAKALAAEAMPGLDPSGIYSPLRQLIDDGLVRLTDDGDFKLSSSGHDLAPLYQALSSWAAGRPLAHGAAHPLWGRAPVPSQPTSRPWATTQSRLPAPAAAPAPQATPPTGASALAWKAGDLFSHQKPARPLAASPTGGPRR